MNYQVALNFGTEGTSVQEVLNVSDIQFFNEAYYFYNDSSDIIFIAPQSTVTFIKRK